MECSLSGASKKQVIRTFKERYELNDEQVKTMIDICSFKQKPKKINYLDFYNRR